ncbi:MAG: MFS transporter [Acidimicrobiales bacterium]
MTSRRLAVRVLGHPAYRRFWIGMVVSTSGTWVRQLAASVFVLADTGSAAMVGLVNFFGFIPIPFVSLLAGHVVDRTSCRGVLVRTQAVAATISGAMAVTALTGHLTTPLVLAGVCVLGASYAFTKPASQAILPELVPAHLLTDAVAMQSLQFTLGLAIGPVVAALVLRWSGTAAALGLDAASFVVLLVAAAGLPSRAARPMTASGGARRSIGEGITFVLRRHALVVLLVGMVSSTIAIEVVKTLMPVFSVRSFGMSAGSAGLLIGAFGVGAAVGAVYAPDVRDLLGASASGTCLAALGTSVVAFSNVRLLAVAVALLVVAGVAFQAGTVFMTSQFFEVVPEQLRGRVFAIHSLSFLGVSPFAAAASGFLAEAVGVRFSGSVTGGCALVGGAALLAHGARRGAPGAGPEEQPSAADHDVDEGGATLPDGAERR